MLLKDLETALKFYFITDALSDSLSIKDQVRIAVEAGATTVQYRNKNFSLCDYDYLVEICSFCRKSGVLFIINDNILLAKAIGADGVHLGQKDEEIFLARKVLGDTAVIGLSISSVEELNKSDLSGCNYIGVGPVFYTKTKLDAKYPHGLVVLRQIVEQSSVPIVAIGGIDSTNAALCIENGVHGVAVISTITRSDNPVKAATDLAYVCFSLA